MSSIFCANCGHHWENDMMELPTTPVPDGPDLLDGHHAASPGTFDVGSNICCYLDKITHLQIVMGRVIQKRDALVTPITRLPPEVLSEIFIHCIDMCSFDLHDQRNLTPRLDKTPLLLGSVCSRWRSISLSTPRLWASFTLTIRPTYQKNDVVLANTWLARAGTCPLYISLGSLGSYQNCMRPLMKVFARHCEHWYDVYLSLPRHVLRSLSAVKNRLPRLRKLHFSGSLDSIDIFESAPQLCSFRQDWPIDKAVKIPWNQLREFSTGWCNVEDYLAILRLAPNLEVLVAFLTGIEPCHPHPLIQLSHLHSLSIRGNLTHVLYRLVLPKLRSVSIDTLFAKWTIPQLTSIFSQCSIEFLSCNIDTHLVSDDDMIQVLQVCPSLLKLDLLGSNSCCMTKSFLSQLACCRDEDNATTVLVPKLHAMTVDYVPSYFCMQDFVDAIQSRMMLGGEGRPEPEVTRLKTVEIRHIHGILETNILLRLRQLKATGLDIRLLSGGKDLL
jgi:F-box-like